MMKKFDNKLIGKLVGKEKSDEKKKEKKKERKSELKLRRKSSVNQLEDIKKDTKELETIKTEAEEKKKEAKAKKEKEAKEVKETEKVEADEKKKEAKAKKEMKEAPTKDVDTKTEASKLGGEEGVPATTPGATLVASPEVLKWVQRALDMGVDNLRNEYRSLAKYTMAEMTIEAFNANSAAGRNRYQDVPCQDQDRVVLRRGPVDYVHANYVSTPKDPKRFICTQGPLDGTINEFWAMVIQENACVIVMLCNTIELGKYKCAQYWPVKPGEVMKFDPINAQVKNLDVYPMPNEPTINISKLEVLFKDGNENKGRIVLHHQWVDWPDRGVPPCRLTSMELLSAVRGSKFPIVVHCSAGIGRTGTIVAIEYILQRLCANENCAAMDELLKKLRNQRAYSIQNDLQYLYVHRVMLCYFLEKHKARYGSILAGDNKAKYDKFIADYNAATGQ